MSYRDVRLTPPSPLHSFWLLVLVLSSAGAPAIHAQSPPAAVLPEPKHSPEVMAPFTVASSLSHDQIASDEPVTLRISLRNLDSRSIENPRVESIDAPGFEAAEVAENLGDRRKLGAADQVEFRTVLTLSDPRTGGRTISVTLAWERGGHLERVSTSTSIKVISPWSADRKPRLFLLLDILKGVALPLAVVLIGVFANQLLQKRSEQVELLRRERSERLEKQRLERNTALEELRRRRSERLEALKQLLSRVWPIAEVHYLPIGSAALKVVEELKSLEKLEESRTLGKSDDGARPSCASLLAAYLILCWKDARLTEKVGGWVLQNRAGEYLVGSLWKDFTRLRDDRIDRRTLDRLLLGLGQDPRLAELLQRFSTHPSDEQDPEAGLLADWTTLRRRFELWLYEDRPAFRATVLLLQTFQTLLVLETNRLYAPLYSLSDDFTSVVGQFEAKELRTKAEELRTTAEGLDEGQKDLRALLVEQSARVNEYLDHLQAETDPGGAGSGVGSDADRKKGSAASD